MHIISIHLSNYFFRINSSNWNFCSNDKYTLRTYDMCIDKLPFRKIVLRYTLISSVQEYPFPTGLDGDNLLSCG